MNKNYDYKRLTPFKWFVLQNFPFIDEDFDAITNYQLFCKLGEEINKLILSMNQAGTQVEELTDYVSTYFDNLDVQDEIDNKLDKMVEDGTLQEIITEYINLKSILCFDTVADMKNATNLVNGSYVETFGFYALNDGGNAKYKIRTITNQDVIDNSKLFPITNDNTLVAELIYNKVLNVKTFGAKGDGITNDSTIIQNVINTAEEGDTIYFPNGRYLVSNLSITKRLNLVGENSTTIGIKGSTLVLANENEKLIDISGTNSVRLVGSSIRNLSFNGGMKETTTLISVKYTQFFNFTECSFNDVNGSAIQFACTFESGIYKSVFRRCGNEINGVIDLLNYLDNNASNNTNNFHIENNTFGYNSGNWIKVEDSANTDILWIKNNKFEHDSTPPWENENYQSLIYLGQIGRCYIIDNSFMSITPSANKYDKIIYAKNGSGPVSIIDNKLSSCLGTFITSNSPIIISNNNILFNGNALKDVDMSNSQTIHQITPSNHYNTNGSRSATYSNATKLQNYTEYTQIPNSAKYELAYDETSLNYTKQVVKTNPNTRAGYFKNNYKDYYNDNVVFKIRAKKVGSASGSPVIQVFKETSGGDSYLNIIQTISATNWTWYNISIPKSSLTDANNIMFIMNDNSNHALLDGVILP